MVEGKKKRAPTKWMMHVKSTMKMPENKGKAFKEILQIAATTYKKSPAEGKKKKAKRTRKCKYGRTKKGKCRRKYGGNKGDESRSRRDYGRKRRSRRRRRKR